MATEPSAPARRTAVNTLIFSVATGLSRIAGLIREVVAAAYFGTGGPASAFTLAFQIPNLIRALVADAALSSAFVPVFSELLEQKRRKEAYELAAALAGLLLVALTVITVAFIALAPIIIPPFTGDEFTPALDALCIGLSQVLFPIVVLLGLTGLAVGVLNVHDHFTIPAIAPLVWNVVIIAGLVGLAPLFEGPDRLYAYALGVVAGTLVQLLMMIPALRRIGYPVFHIRLPRRGDERVKRVLMLMLPVSVGLGLININLLLNSTIGSRVSDGVPRAIDAAFRIYMLPQGMFSVAVATVLFPQLSRLAARGDRDGLRAILGVGLRQIALLLIPAGAAMLALSEPIVRLVYERGEWTAQSTELTADALFWFAFSLPFSGFVLMLTRGFFSLQRPWTPTTLAVGSLAVNAVGSYALSGPFGIAGIVIGTIASNVVLVLAEAFWLRRALHGFETLRTLRAIAGMLLGAAILAAISYAAWWALDQALGRSLPAQIVSVGVALIAGAAAYAAIVLALKIPEARQVLDLFASRLRRS
ncbi:MAG TPA: murein biosynthesis integral membrane protein MurJ [Solirubrobacter sp.]|nr:murein biosynthesis integral membrane protein MurJ [Solirubrobacter sp.]